MTNVIIDELLDVGNDQIEDAKAIIQQNGLSFKARTRPNPPRQINVSSQEQLEIQFGSNIEIPNGESFSIVVDDTFELDKPIKIGLGSSLSINAAVINNAIIYTGAGQAIQNTNTAELIDSFNILNMFIIGGDTESVFNLKGTGVFNCDGTRFVSFGGVGTVDFPTSLINNHSLIDTANGWVIVNPLDLVVTSAILIPFDPTGITLFSVISSVVGRSTFTDIRERGMFAGDALFFLDPNAPAGSNFVITQSPNPIAGDFYQQGIDIAATAATASGSDTQFDITAHGLVKGQIVVLKDFTNFTGYNETFRVTAINDANSVDIEVEFLGVDATGNMNASSLVSTDIKVSAIENQDQQDSMFTAESGFEDSGASLTAITAIGVPSVIVNGSFAFTNMERFEEGISNQGQVVALDGATRKYVVNYGGSLTKATGGTIIMGFVLLVNGSIVGFNPPRTPDINSAQISSVNIIELSAPDVLQVGVVNYTDSNDIIVTHVDLVINRA